MDVTPFKSLTREGYDVAVAYDYTELEPVGDFDPARYSEIVILSWSFGVAAAAMFMMQHPELPITRAMAVNGTPWPEDELRGIPAAVCRGTLEGLTDRNLRKFMMRMCGGATAWKRFEPSAPARTDIEELKTELSRICGRESLPEGVTALFDSVHIGLTDAIVPPDNQHRAWSGHHCVVSHPDWPHLPDFQALINTEVVPKSLVNRSFGKAANTYVANAGVQSTVAGHLDALWRRHDDGRRYKRIIEVGAGTGLFTHRYAADRQIGSLELWDIADYSGCDTVAGAVRRQTDAELAIISEPERSADAIVSASTLQWFNSPARFMQRCGRVLTSGGMMVLSVYGPDTFREIAHLQTARLPYMTLEQWCASIPQELQLIEAYEEKIVSDFASAKALVEHLRGTGVNAVGGNSIAAARFLVNLKAAELTYHPIYLLLYKP